MKNIVILALSIPLYFACSRGERSILTENVDIENIASFARDTGFPVDSIANPVGVLSLGDYLILSSLDSHFVLSVYNRKTQSFQRIGRLGRGENEILNAGTIGIYPLPEKTAFYLYDNFAEKLLIYTITDDVCELWDIQEMKGFMALLFDDNLAIGTSGVKNRYLLRDLKTGFDCYFGDTKYSAEFCEKVGFTMSSPVINRSLKRIAYFSPFGEAYEIMDYNHPHAIKSVFHKIYEGVIYADASNDVLSIETKEGFNGATGSDDNIFVLCDELTIAERGLSSLANNICVLDWEGNYIKRLVCDKAMSCVCFDQDKSELFAVILDDDAMYKVVSFPAEEILN